MIIKNLKCDLIGVYLKMLQLLRIDLTFSKIYYETKLTSNFFHLIRSLITLIVKFLKFEKVINLYINKSYKKFNSKNLYIKIFQMMPQNA